MPPPPRVLSREPRRQRRVFGLSLLGTVAAQIVSLFQMGPVRRLPDPPVGPFASDRVDASDYAYNRLETPNGAPMLVSYGVTAALRAAGGRRTEGEPRVLRPLPGGDAGVLRPGAAGGRAGGAGAHPVRVGSHSTSSIRRAPEASIAKRSKPSAMPLPAGIPCSSARRKSSSTSQVPPSSAP